MKCSVETTCDNPHLEKVDNQVFVSIVTVYMN